MAIDLSKSTVRAIQLAACIILLVVLAEYPLIAGYLFLVGREAPPSLVDLAKTCVLFMIGTVWLVVKEPS